MKVTFDGKSHNLPDILLLGVAKSGTTSLAFFLKQHPDVFMPVKEPGFFAYHDRPDSEIPSGIRDRQIVDLEAYSKMYQKAGGNQLICDATVAQFSNHVNTIENAKKLYGPKLANVKAALVLRNPVDRAFSHYLMFLKNGIETLTFEEAIAPHIAESRVKEQLGFDYIGGSMYFDRVKAFKEAFPQLRVYLTEDLKKPNEVLVDFMSFCGLRSDVKIDTSARLNPSGIPKKKGVIKLLHKRSPAKEWLKRMLPDKLQYRLLAVKSGLIERSIERTELDTSLKAELTERHFKDDIEKLQKLIGRDLSNWIQDKRMQ